MIEILEGRKGLNDFKFGTLIGRFPRDSAASIAMKGLIKRPLDCVVIFGRRRRKRRTRRRVIK